jgi:thiol-disulfide isomerase/thioredoxin
MKVLFVYLFSCIALLASAQQKQAFKISPSIMEQGDQIHIHYNPAVNGVTANTPVKGSVYLFKDFKWEGLDLPLLKSDSGYTANYQIPSGVGMLAFRFALGDSIDRGGRFPYGTVVYAKGKKIAPGSFIEWGLFRSKDANGEMSPLVAKESLITPNVLVQLWISKEFNIPQTKRRLFFEIANGIKSYMPKEKADSILYKAAAEIVAMPDATEKELIAVEKVYRTMLMDAAKADALRGDLLAKYPEGLTRRMELIKAIYGEMDGEKKIQLWKDFVKRYPFASFPIADYVDPVLGDRAFFSNAFVGVANLSFRKHDLQQISKMADDGAFKMINYFYEHYVIYPFRLQVSPITELEALSLSTSLTNGFLSRLSRASLDDRGIFAPSEWKKQEMINNSWMLAHHVSLLYKHKNYAEALKIADQIKAYVGYKNIDFNNVYTKLLYHFHKQDVAKSYIIAAIKADTADPEMIASLKSGYVKSDGAGKSFDAYYESLRPGDKLQRMQKKLKASMVKIPAMNFNLENLSGQRIELTKQKGKIVVLDFWASWCFPCKAAMPGMQTLVKKYEPTGDAAFFFIATMEHDPNYKKLIHDFLAAKKYDFNVLYDAEDPETKKMGLVFNDYAKVLKLSGIPQKIVIDQDGFIRWVSAGFSGDLVELTDEVSYIIEQLKNEKQTSR